MTIKKLNLGMFQKSRTLIKIPGGCDHNNSGNRLFDLIAAEQFR